MITGLWGDGPGPPRGHALPDHGLDGHAQAAAAAAPADPRRRRRASGCSSSRPGEADIVGAQHRRSASGRIDEAAGPTRDRRGHPGEGRLDPRRGRRSVRRPRAAGADRTCAVVTDDREPLLEALAGGFGPDPRPRPGSRPTRWPAPSTRSSSTARAARALRHLLHRGRRATPLDAWPPSSPSSPGLTLTRPSRPGRGPGSEPDAGRAGRSLPDVAVDRAMRTTSPVCGRVDHLAAADVHGRRGGRGCRRRRGRRAGAGRREMRWVAAYIGRPTSAAATLPTPCPGPHRRGPSSRSRPGTAPAQR